MIVHRVVSGFSRTRQGPPEGGHYFRLRLTVGALAFFATCALAAQEAPPPPRILLDQPLRAVEYQLERLTNDEIVRLERRPTDSRYRPVYLALLTRQGLTHEIREEALAALVEIDHAPASAILLEALARIRPEDESVADKLVAMLLAQPAGALRDQRAAFSRAIETSASPFVLRGAYGAVIAGDGSRDAAWQLAASRPDHLPPALLALVAARPDTATFRVLAETVARGPEPPRRAAVRGLQALPESAWPQASELEPLVAALVAAVRAAPQEQRTDPDAIDAMQLAERLSAALPEAPRLALRRDLRGLGVRVVRIAAVPEQMKFDVQWFAAQAGAALQIVFVNPDAMPHNLIVGAPKSVEAIGTAGVAVGMPADPAVKPFVPDSPLVLYATGLLKEGEVARLSVTAPAQPGEYVFLCSFPGHWIRMYGVMLVVADLEAFEANPAPPTDPLTGKPYDK